MQEITSAVKCRLQAADPIQRERSARLGNHSKVSKKAAARGCRCPPMELKKYSNFCSITRNGEHERHPLSNDLTEEKDIQGSVQAHAESVGRHSS